MFQRFLIAILGIAIGLTGGYLLILATTPKATKNLNQNPLTPPKKEIIGFLPFWLIDKADKDYSPYITTLSYFNLNLDSDGTILRYVNQVEGDPGYFALKNGKADALFDNAKKSGDKLSLTVFSGDEEKIARILDDPTAHAQNLINEVVPIMQQYGFSDLNLDVESVQDATPEARAKFTQFVREVKKGIDEKNLGTLTIDISPIAFVRDKNLADPSSIAPNVDYVVLMAYDFHNPGSLVTGPVSPTFGAGTISEFDTETAVQKAIGIMPASKVILGIPLYGYSWESINAIPRSAIIPGTAIIISNRTVEDFLSNCATCSAEYDPTDKEPHIIYKNANTGTYQQIFYPDQTATQEKVNLAQNYSLGGMALWAIGYEGQTILSPLSAYHH